MTNSSALDDNDRDAGVVEEICGYLTDIPPRNLLPFWAGAGFCKNTNFA